MAQKKKDVDYNYTIFEYFAEQHNLTLLEGEINDIVHLVNSALITELQAKGAELQAAVNQYNAVVQQNKELQQELIQTKEKIKPFADEYFSGLTYSEIAKLAKKTIRLTTENRNLETALEEIDRVIKNLEKQDILTFPDFPLQENYKVIMKQCNRGYIDILDIINKAKGRIDD